ncbi:hypothetical protein NDU88_003518 [Pleurodeles waltl]|uniref:Uncharacterized protein n=1 Tax=Pleurodeles waltl TaxID=8319 RepID=A0AAV7W2E9_PLEWA|nr:hypothetical protein NDU88_003518 [Pleurodeles waltl]
MAASFDADRLKRSRLEERKLGDPCKMAAPVSNIDDEVVVISDEEVEVRTWGEDGASAVGRLADVQSLPVKVKAPFRHRAEGRVKPGTVYLTSREAAGAGSMRQCDDPVVDVRPSTSRGAGVSLERIEVELLDYDDEVEEHVTSVQRGDAMKPRVIPKVVQGDHIGVRHLELVAGSLPRGEKGVFVSVGLGGVREGVGDATQKVGKDICGVTNEQRKGRVDASIQVASGAQTEPVLYGLWGTHLFVGLRSKLHRGLLVGN